MWHSESQWDIVIVSQQGARTRLNGLNLSSHLWGWETEGIGGSPAMDSRAVEKCRGRRTLPEVEQDQVGALDGSTLVERKPMDWARWVPFNGGTHLECFSASWTGRSRGGKPRELHSGGPTHSGGGSGLVVAMHSRMKRKRARRPRQWQDECALIMCIYLCIATWLAVVFLS